MRKGLVFLVVLLGFVSLAPRAECCSGYLITAGEACGEIALPPAGRVAVPRAQQPIQHLQAGDASWLRAARTWLSELSGLWAPAPHGLTAGRAGDASTPLPASDATIKDHVDNPGQTAMK